MRGQRQRALVAHLGGIGDFILTCPALTKLAEQYSITLVGYRERLLLGVAAGIAEEAYDWESVGFETLFHEPDERIRELVAHHDRAVIWMKDADAVKDSLQTLGVKWVECFPGLPPVDWGQHASLYYARCLQFDDVPMLHWRFSDEIRPTAVLIHPGSGSPKKNWHLEGFCEVFEYVRAAGYCPEFILGPAEEAIIEKLAYPHIQTDSLTKLAGYLAGARLFVGNDSGITHLAAATGCSTVAIFGPTDPIVWGPRGHNVMVINGNPWPSVSDVICACRTALDDTRKLRHACADESRLEKQEGKI